MTILLHLYNGISVLLILLLTAWMIQAVRRKDNYRVIFGISIALSILTLGSNLVYLNARQVQTATISSNIFQIVSLGMELGIAMFSMRYTDQEKDFRIAIRIVGLLYTLDCICLIINMFNGFMYTVGTKERYGLVYWIVEETEFFRLHEVATLSIALVAVLPLMIRIAKSATLYKQRFVILLVAIGLTIVLHSVSRVTDNPVELSVLLYAMVAGAASVFVTYGAPRQLVEKMIQMSNDSISDGLICYDAKGVCMFYNRKAKELFDYESNITLAMEKYRKNRLTDANRLVEYEEEWEESFIVNGAEHVCDITYHQICQKKHIIGGYLQFIDKTDELQMYEQQRYQATHDSLTGLYNRERFFQEVEKRLKEKPKAQWMMIVSNIRDFRLVNELFGEEKADAVLIREAEYLRKYSHPSNIYARMMDDKFALLMEKRHFSPDFLMGCMEGMKTVNDNSAFRMHIQAGIYEIDDATEPALVIYDKAVFALSEADDDYRKIFSFYDSSKMEQLMRDRDCISDFDESMERGEFQMFVQSQYDGEGHLQGVDTVRCMVSPERGILSEEELLPALEHLGAVHKLDRYIWELAMQTLASWKTSAPELYISIHVSAKDLYYMDVLQELESLREKYAVSPSKIHVEIEEATLMLNPKNNLALLQMFQEKGYYIVISDFGSGYSSLNMLKDMHPDAIQLDHILTPEGEENQRNWIVVKATLDMARKLGIHTIVCGIQKREQVDFLKEHHTQTFQGSYFEVPVPVADMEQFNQIHPVESV